MVAVVDVISIAAATSPPVRKSHHWPSGPGGREGRAGGGDSRVTPGGGRKRRRVVQSNVAAWVWRRNQAPDWLSISFSFGLRSPDVPCTADPPLPTAGSRELPAPSSARGSSACPSLSQHSLEAPPPQPLWATVSGLARQAPPPLLSTQPPARISQDAARGREVWSGGTLRPRRESARWRL